MRKSPHLLPLLLLCSCMRLEVVEELDSLTGRPLYRGLAERNDGVLLAQSDWVFWHKNGRILARGAFRDAPFPGSGAGVIAASIPARGRDGLWTFWSAEGQIRARGAYAGGLMSGEWTCWYKNGQRCWWGAFSAGQPDGSHVRWNTLGTKVEECAYAAGLLHGQRRVWSDAGVLICRELYEHGTLIEGDGCERAPPPEIVNLGSLDEELEELLVSLHQP